MAVRPQAPAGYVTWDGLIQEVQPSVPGCPPWVIADAIRDESREVCRRTGAWKYTMGLVSLGAGVHVYGYDLPWDSEIDKVLAVRLLSRVPDDPDAEWQVSELEPASVEAALSGDLVGVGAGWPDSRRIEGQPRYYMEWEPGYFAVAPTPDRERQYQVRFRLTLRPTPDALWMAEGPFAAVRGALYHAVLKHLYAQAQPWSSHAKREYHAREYAFRVNREAGESGEVRVPKFVRPVAGWA